MSRGEFDSLFPDKAAFLRHRSKIEATVQQAWQSLMPDNPDPMKTGVVFKKMQKKSRLIFSHGGLTQVPLPADWFSQVLYA